jgi:flagella basal body P-ring formation protein FlgA
MIAALILASATPYADLAIVDAHVARFTGAAIGQPGGAIQPVDRRLRLKACQGALALGWHGTRRETVVVQCPDPGGWRLFVPLKAAPVAVAVQTKPVVQRGEGVTISVSGQGFAVSQPGEAMEPGAVGDWIRVRPAKAGSRQGGSPMRARIVRPGVVELPVR